MSTFYSVAAAMQALSEEPRAVDGGLLGVARRSMAMDSEAAIAFRLNLATTTATVVRMAMKAIYLLDSANVEITEMPVSRQVRRKARRDAAEIAWVIRVRPTRSTEERPRFVGSNFLPIPLCPPSRRFAPGTE